MSDIALEIPFLGGIDQSTRDEVLDASASYTSLYNVRQNQMGGASKRLGFLAATRTRLDATTRAAGSRLFMNGDQVCIIDGTDLDVYSGALDRSIVKGRVPEANYRLIDGPTLGQDAVVDDVVYCNGYSVVVHTVTLNDPLAEGNFSYAVVLDASNGAIVRSAEYLDGDSSEEASTRLATYGVYVIAITFGINESAIRGKYLDTTSAATVEAGWLDMGTLATDLLDSSDIASLPAHDCIAIAYTNESGGASQITVRTVTIAGVGTTTTINTASTQPADGCVAMSEAGSTLWVAWNQTTTIKACGLDASSIGSTPLAATATILSTSTDSVSTDPTALWIAFTSTGKAALYAETSLALHIQGVKTTTGTAATDGSEAIVFNARLQGRPFIHGGAVYAPFSSSNAAEVIVCDCTPDATGDPDLTTFLRPVVAPVQREIFAAAPFLRRTRTAALSASQYLFGFMVKKSGATVGSTLAVYDFADVHRWQAAVLNGSTFLGGGVTTVFDGDKLSEAAFLCRPPVPTLDVGSSGSLTLSTGRRYVATYEQVDADGNWHVSGVSDPSASTGAVSSKAVKASVSPLSITSRGSVAGPTGSSLRVSLWATKDGNEAPYFRVGTLSNDPNTLLLVYTDNADDDALSTHAQLYSEGNLPGTNGAGQDHRAPPGLTHLVSYNGMLVGATGKLLFFSSEPIDGEGTWFSPAFSAILDDDVTSLEVMDGSLVIFMARRIYVVAGEPPNDTGTQGGLGIPRRLAVDVGSIDGQTVATSEGIFFRSDRGIDRLTRGLAVEFAGQMVMDEVAGFPAITAMALDTKNNIVRISLAESRDSSGLASGNGRDVIYDLILKKWVSIDRKHGSASEQPSQDSAMVYYGGSWRYAWLGTDGTMYVERLSGAGNDCLDGSTWVTQGATTPWVHIAGLQGEQLIDQVLLLAKQATAHDLTMELAFDYADTFTSSKTFTAAQLGTLAREWLVKEVAQTTSNAIRVRITDATPSSGSIGTGEGGAWVCLTFGGAPHRGPKRSTGAQRGGA